MKKMACKTMTTVMRKLKIMIIDLLLLAISMYLISILALL